jgi:lipoprotein-releasing system ATP-binding protein
MSKSLSPSKVSPPKVSLPNGVEQTRYRVVHADGETDIPIATLASPSILRARGLTKSYRKQNVVVPVLRGVDFQAEEKRITAIVGQSGSGKSTLLHLLGTLDQPDEGEIYFNGARIDNVSTRQRDQFRNTQLGMIFQFYHLLPELTLLENILAPAMIRHGIISYWKHRSELRDRARELAATVGLEHRLRHRPSQLSGGEMQRTAIARALILNPALLLADEPTGNLDQETGTSILGLLQKLNEERDLTIVMVTHDEYVASQCDAVVRLKGGRVEKLK